MSTSRLECREYGEQEAFPPRHSLGFRVSGKLIKKRFLPDPSISHWASRFTRRKQSSGAFLRIVEGLGLRVEGNRGAFLRIFSQNTCHSDRHARFVCSSNRRRDGSFREALVSEGSARYLLPTACLWSLQNGPSAERQGGSTRGC